MKKILIGGSPCTHWSIAKLDNRETEAEGIGWELFRNYLIAKEKFQPDFFLYENNKSAAQSIKDQISLELGVPLQYINSALVSAQNRPRFYAHNIPNVPQPEDRGLFIADILENDPVDERYYFTEKTYASIEKILKRSKEKGLGFRTGIVSDLKNKKFLNLDANYHKGSDGKRTMLEVNGRARMATPIEAERLQTLPDNYTAAVSNTQRYRGLGNGWTAEVIIHVLKHMNIPLDEEIIVLSMYDGIGTGRYCFDKMGYKNIRYFAYEIDPYPMKVAMSNYPDIIQMGDAFKVREDNWNLEY